MWRRDRVLMVPLVMSATGVIPRTPPKNLKELGISGGGAITMMQKAALLGPEVPESSLNNSIIK